MSRTFKTVDYDQALDLTVRLGDRLLIQIMDCNKITRVDHTRRPSRGRAVLPGGQAMSAYRQLIGPLTHAPNKLLNPIIGPGKVAGVFCCIPLSRPVA